jgi:hypothetical protein
MTKRRIINHFIAIVIKMSYLLVIVFLTGCSPIRKIILDQEQTIIMTSYYDDKVLKALETDINSRLNASYLDLETGSISQTDDKFTDVYYELSCGSQCFARFGPMENAKLMPSKKQNPTIQDCLVILDKVKFGSKSLSNYPGSYTCVQTSEGRVGWIRYDKDFTSGLKPGELQITYWIWEKDGD